MTPKDFQISDELKNHDFRVSIFGSARIQPEDPVYQDAYNLAKVIGGMGVDLITGGGPGLMEAASLGHTAGDIKNRAHSIGLNIVLPFEQKPNEGLEFLDNHEVFSTRLDEFMLLSSAVVVMPGGIGTCLELFYTWQLLQVKHICNMPVILVGKMWRELINWIIDNPLKGKLMDPKDLHFIVVVDNWKQAVKVIKKAKKHYDQNPDACHNWIQYGKKLRKLSPYIDPQTGKPKGMG
ncbi:MAG: LOG family protein [Candidatus Gracilibacteria bacterium]